MRVFVTGSTGYIGSAVVRALVAAGHEVGGLVRSRDKEEAVRRMGAVPIYGHLQDPETYQHFAAESRAVVHAAFETSDADTLSTEALVGALVAEGEEKTFVYTSGVWVLGPQRDTVNEDAPLDSPAELVAWRPRVEQYVLSHGNEMIATNVLRPGLVYGGRRGLLANWFASAEQKGEITYIGDGTNRIPPVHVDDLAQLYRLIVEKHASGVFHGVDGTAPTVREIADACAKAVGPKVKTRGWPLAEAHREYGGYADCMAMDQNVGAKRARALGWAPKHRPLPEGAADAHREWKA